MRETWSKYTMLGVFIVIAVTPVILMIFSMNAPIPLTNGFVVIREFTVFALAGLLVLVLVRGEKSSLESIGLHGGTWLKSIMWGLAGLVLCLIVAVSCIQVLRRVGVEDPGAMNAYNSLSKGVLILVALRAAVVEEIFFRGFLMERIKIFSRNPWVYVLLPALIFALLHYQLGIRGIVIAFGLGLTLAYVYIKSGDLKASIIAHFLVDFMSLVIFPPPES